MSFKATSAFVEYIYGFDAGEENGDEKNEPNNDEEDTEDADDDGDNSLDLDTIKELILVAGIYEDTLKGNEQLFDTILLSTSALMFALFLIKITLVTF